MECAPLAFNITRGFEPDNICGIVNGRVPSSISQHWTTYTRVFVTVVLLHVRRSMSAHNERCGTLLNNLLKTSPQQNKDRRPSGTRAATATNENTAALTATEAQTATAYHRPSQSKWGRCSDEALDLPPLRHLHAQFRILAQEC